MSSVSRPVIDSGNESAESGTVSELVSLLRSAFQPKDFLKVEQIMMTREANMKREIANWKGEYELMEKKHGEMALMKLEIEDDLNKHRLECDVLREKVTRLEEDGRIRCDREKRAEARYARLLEDFTKTEAENRKLGLMNSDLVSAKNKAERAFENRKKRFEELSLRVLRLETELTMMKREDQNPKEHELGEERLVSVEMAGVKKTANDGNAENEAGVGTGSGISALQQLNDFIQNCNEKGDNLVGSGSTSDSMEVRSDRLKEAAGKSDNEVGVRSGMGDFSHPQLKESISNGQGNDHSLAGAARAGSASNFPELKSIHLQEAGQPAVIKSCNSDKGVQKQLVSERSPIKVAGDGRAGSGVVIEISDSDDDMPPRDWKTIMQPNTVASRVMLSDKKVYNAHSDQTGNGCGRSCMENCLLHSSTKRKRGSCTNVCESKNGDEDDDDDDDKSPFSKCKTNALKELLVDGNDSSSSGDSSSSDSDVESVIAMLWSNYANKKKWMLEVNMTSAFRRDPELCMNAVCALYRQEMRKTECTNEALLAEKRGFHGFNAVRGIRLGEYLTNKDPQFKLNRSVSDLQQHDPDGLRDCRELAIQHSGQLFEIYMKKEDPFFPPPQDSKA